MTFVGKLLVIVQVALSICFMTFAGAVYTVQTNWRTKADDLTTKLALSKEQQIDLEEEFGQYKTKMTAELTQEKNRADLAETGLSNLQANYSQIEKDLNSVRQERDNYKQISDNAVNESKEYKQLADRRLEVNLALNKKVSDQIDVINQLKQTNFDFRIERERMITKHDGILNQLATLTKIMAYLDLSTKLEAYPDLKDPPPSVEALVKNSVKDRNGIELLEILFGLDDGVGKGDTLTIYRKPSGSDKYGKYLGKAEIIEVRPDVCVAMMVRRAPNTTLEGGKIYATTKLK